MAQMEGTPNNLEQFFGDVEKRNRLASAWDNLPEGAAVARYAGDASSAA